MTDGSAEITKDQAIESLGADAAKYVVVSWTKEEAEATAAE